MIVGVRIWVGLLLLLCAHGVCRAQAGLPQAMQQAVDRAAAEVLAQTGVPSASIAVVRDGKPVYVKAYGKARLDPVMNATPAMQYAIGSVSKQFTAALILLLQQDGKLKLDEPVGTWLPQLTRAKEVTLRQVLSMTSGYQDFWPEDYVMTSMMVATTPEHILEVWGRKPLDFEPGTKWQYSNTNYVIAGRIAEIVGGGSVVAQLRERIFGPLGMDEVLDADASHLPGTDPTGYYRHALGPLRPAPQEGAGWMFAAGELAMPTRDLAKWNVSLIDRSLLRPESYDEMFREVKLKDGAGTHYGLGVEVLTHEGQTVIEHSGEVSGFVSENVVYPGLRGAVTVLTNEDASSGARILAQQIATAVFASDRAAKPGEAAQAELRTTQILQALQQGQIERSQFTAFANAYFSSEALADFEASLKPLGKLRSVHQTGEALRGGMIFRAMDASFADGRSLRVTEYEMPDGKLEQFLVEAKGS